MNQRFNLLVFDWDGTLMDSEASIVACMQGAIGDLGCDPRSTDEIKNIIGLGLREAIDTLYPGSDDTFLKAMVDRYRYHFLGGRGEMAELFPGAEETIRALSDAGYLLAVATGKGRRGLDMVLAQTGLARYFHATRCADETFSKPHPQMLEEVMELVGAEPGETLMIGDTEYDMQMANNARTHALAVSYGVHERERLLQHDPLHCLDDIAELTDWLAARAGYTVTN
ncbi:MAG: HAD-IA family hydrolase [Chromatiales bacterium]|nr:HAD-IA family hydrolase [Chromatiales bacterium]